MARIFTVANIISTDFAGTSLRVYSYFIDGRPFLQSRFTVPSSENQKTEKSGFKVKDGTIAGKSKQNTTVNTQSQNQNKKE